MNGIVLRKIFLNSPAVAISTAYVVAGNLWILFSDQAVTLLAPDRASLVRLQAVKGWLFVLATGILLLLLLRAYQKALTLRESALREKHRTLSTLLKNLPGMAYRCGNDPSWTMEFVSQGAKDLTGYGPLDLIGNAETSYADLIHPEDRDGVWKEVQKAVAQQESFQLVYRIISQDGSEKWVWERGQEVFSESGLALEGFITDITELKNLQEQVGHTQKLEAIGRVAGGVAHDFNNLLTAIRGYCQLLRRDLEAGRSLHHAAKQIEETVDRASNLTRQLLAFSRKQKMERQTLDFNQVVLEMKPLLEHVAGKRVRLGLAVSPTANWVEGDRSQLEQVIMNLAMNAVDAMPSGGDLRLELDQANLDARSANDLQVVPGEYLRLCISDTGTGMDAKTRERIFEPFFTTKEKGKGTGLGLSTVYGILKQSGGHIGVQSFPNEGTTFTAFYPLAVFRRSEGTASKAA